MSVDPNRLKALAEKAIRDGVLSLSMSRFKRAADPQTCLTLIEELEACRRAFKALADYDNRAGYDETEQLHARVRELEAEIIRLLDDRVRGTE